MKKITVIVLTVIAVTAVDIICAVMLRPGADDPSDPTDTNAYLTSEPTTEEWLIEDNTTRFDSFWSERKNDGCFKLGNL